MSTAAFVAELKERLADPDIGNIIECVASTKDVVLALKIIQVYEAALKLIVNEHSHYIGALERSLETRHPFHGVMTALGHTSEQALASADKLVGGEE